MSLFRRSGAEILRTIARALDPSAVAGEIQLYSKLDAGVAQLFARDSAGTIYQITPPPAAAPVVNELWGPRTNPHPADDEFNTNALNVSWSQTGFSDVLNFAVRPAPYAAPADNPASWENLRDPDNTTDPTQNSWLRIQPGNGPAGVWKRLDTAAFGGSVPANLFAWARFRFAWFNASGVGSADADIGMSFFDETGGGFGFANHATINLNNTNEGTVNTHKPLFWGRDGSTITPISEGAPQNQAITNDSAYAFYSGYVGLQKIGADIARAWLFDDGGRLFMGQYTSAGLVMNSVALWCRGNSSLMGIPIFDVDFIRFYQDDDWIP